MEMQLLMCPPLSSDRLVSLQCKSLELKLEEERVFTEYEQVPKKRPDGVVTTAALPENTERNRFRDVVPYEENRVELVPNKENNTGYINASHIKVGEGTLSQGTVWYRGAQRKHFFVHGLQWLLTVFAVRLKLVIF